MSDLSIKKKFKYFLKNENLKNWNYLIEEFIQTKDFSDLKAFLESKNAEIECMFKSINNSSKINFKDMIEKGYECSEIKLKNTKAILIKRNKKSKKLFIKDKFFLRDIEKNIEIRKFKNKYYQIKTSNFSELISLTDLTILKLESKNNFNYLKIERLNEKKYLIEAKNKLGKSISLNISFDKDSNTINLKQENKENYEINVSPKISKYLKKRRFLRRRIFKN